MGHPPSRPKVLAFTLLELLLAVGLSAACFALASLYFFDKTDTFDKENRTKTFSQTCNDALELIAKDLEGIDFSLEGSAELLERFPDTFLFQPFQTLSTCDSSVCSARWMRVRYAIVEAPGQPAGLYRFEDEARETFLVLGCKSLKVTVYTQDKPSQAPIPLGLQAFQEGQPIVYATVDLTVSTSSLKSDKLKHFRKYIYLNCSGSL